MKLLKETRLGITDKYWMTAFVPEAGKNFKSTFLYDEGFKANYIINKPTVINQSSTTLTFATAPASGAEIQFRYI